MQDQYILLEFILLIVFLLASIAIGITTFFKLYRQFGKSPFGCFLAVAGAVLVAFASFVMLAAAFRLIFGRWCEGCQEYH